MSDSVKPHRWQPSRPQDSPGKNTGVGCHFLLQYMKVKSESKWSRSVSVRLFMTPWTTAYQAPPAMGFSRQEYWSGLPLPSPFSSYRDKNTKESEVNEIPRVENLCKSQGESCWCQQGRGPIFWRRCMVWPCRWPSSPRVSSCPWSVLRPAKKQEESTAALHPCKVYFTCLSNSPLHGFLPETQNPEVFPTPYLQADMVRLRKMFLDTLVFCWVYQLSGKPVNLNFVLILETEITKQKQIHRHRKQTYGYQMGRGER